ncbi:hypothetical protein LJC19_00280 [Oxalobacter sp. OttesenSCG-928-P03]|nr:hypothetical protein [Oxalobacter sp. OttesenSCG-928-P03]
MVLAGVRGGNARFAVLIRALHFIWQHATVFAFADLCHGMAGVLLFVM